MTEKPKVLLTGADDPLLRRGCRDKNVWFSRKAAKAALRRYKGEGRNGARHCYRCPHCNGFHLSTRAHGDKWNGKVDKSKEANLRLSEQKREFARAKAAKETDT